MNSVLLASPYPSGLSDRISDTEMEASFILFCRWTNKCRGMGFLIRG